MTCFHTILHEQRMVRSRDAHPTCIPFMKFGFPPSTLPTPPSHPSSVSRKSMIDRGSRSGAWFLESSNN
jgi:hypothetical protein